MAGMSAVQSREQCQRKAESCWICLPSKCQGSTRSSPLLLHPRYPCEVPLVDSALGKVQAGSPLSYEHHHDS
ncbi:hypothetical protein NQZ68_026365 [Dissostichus eleginoides]|nr:hypothetical protein NQZ68_026365 [Dissostichus eleginoides]